MLYFLSMDLNDKDILNNKEYKNNRANRIQVEKSL